jgi:ribonucleoside-diphosphate reductase alpha chain
MAKSLVDYIFRWLAMEFVPGYRAVNAPKRKEKSEARSQKSEAKPDSGVATSVAMSPAPEAATRKKSGNGHGPRLDPDTIKPFDYDDESPSPSTLGEGRGEGSVPPSSPGVSNLRLAIVATDPLSQQGSEMQADAPACDVCGSITVRSGTCYKCLNCGNSMGCS